MILQVVCFRKQEGRGGGSLPCLFFYFYRSRDGFKFVDPPRVAKKRKLAVAEEAAPVVAGVAGYNILEGPPSSSLWRLPVV